MCQQKVLSGEDEEAFQSVLNPLFRALEVLRFTARHFHPPQFEELMASVGSPDADLRLTLTNQSTWPAHLADAGEKLEQAGNAALEAFDGLRQILEKGGDARSVPTELCAVFPMRCRHFIRSRRCYRRSTSSSSTRCGRTAGCSNGSSMVLPPAAVA